MSDWPVQTTDKIVSVVDTVRSNTSDRLVSVARWVVYGLLAAFMGLTALVLLAIGLVRVAVVYLDNINHIDPARAVWIAEGGFGAIFTLVGMFLWSKRTARK
jgi:hypothetical protein